MLSLIQSKGNFHSSVPSCVRLDAPPFSYRPIAVRNFISKETGRLVHIDNICEKLKKKITTLMRWMPLYVIASFFVVQDLESEGFLFLKTNNSEPIYIGSPSPNKTMASHPFFQEEFVPFDENFEAIISQLRLRATTSAPSSPPTSPIPVLLASMASSASSSTNILVRGGGSRKRRKYTKSKLNLA